VSAAGLAVTVHERKIVGQYETATISSESAEALTSWLAEHGFQMPALAEPVIADYVKDGWVFVATRLSREAQSGVSTPHPLVFRFETHRCIYPMRLTGVQDRPLSLELYVFGSGRASAPGLKVERSDSAQFKELYGAGLPLTHRGLASLVEGAASGTKLRGTLSPGQMRKDLAIVFGAPGRTGGTIYSAWSAHMIAANFAVAAFIVVAIVTALRLRRRGRNLNTSIAWLAGPVLAAIAAGTAGHLVLPTTENVVYERPLRQSTTHRSIAMRIIVRVGEQRTREVGFIATPAWIRALEEEFGDWDPSAWDKPSGVRWEDSPGNFIVREGGPFGLEYVWYDHNGREHTEYLVLSGGPAAAVEDEVR
jgi:hypothetical protein